jgi:hypothetical protein
LRKISTKSQYFDMPHSFILLESAGMAQESAGMEQESAGMDILESRA